MVLTLPRSILYGLLSRTALTDWLCVTEVEGVFCAARTEPLYKIDTFLR